MIRTLTEDTIIEIAEDGKTFDHSMPLAQLRKEFQNIDWEDEFGEILTGLRKDGIGYLESFAYRIGDMEPAQRADLTGDH